MKAEKRRVQVKNLVIIWMIIFAVMILVYSVLSYMGAKQYEDIINENINTIANALQGTFLVAEITILSETAKAFISFTLVRIITFAILSLFVTITLIVILNSYFYTRKTILIDPLTGIYNKRYYYAMFDKEIARAKRFRHPLSLIIIDIDNFKKFNDRYGHVAGDSLLVELADLLKHSVREVDTVSRFGGEEFCILLPEAKHNDAVAIAESIRTRIEHHKFKSNRRATISLGLVTYKSTKEYPKEEIVRRADALLYAAKSKGKNLVEKVNIEIGKFKD